MVAKVKMFCLFMLMLGTTVLVLILLNWIPRAIQDEGLRKYGSLEEAQKALHLRKIHLPAYFPDRLQWPPFEIYAQSQPFTMVLMHVKERGRDRIALAIRQVEAQVSSPMRLRLEPVQVSRQEQVRIKGREAVWSLASCTDGTVCNTLAWQEEGYVFTLVGRDAAQELLRIAASMLAE